MNHEPEHEPPPSRERSASLAKLPRRRDDPDPRRDDRASRSPSFRIIESSSAAIRLDAAAAFLRGFPPHHPVTIVGATRGAADDLARAVAATRLATFGLHRLSLTQLAARTAIVALARDGFAPGSWLGAEAVATRAAFEATRDAALGYVAPVATAPGFPRALAATLQELRLAGVPSARLGPLPLAGPISPTC